MILFHSPAKDATCQMSCCQVINFEGLVIQRSKRVYSHTTFCDFLNRFIATLQSSFISQRAPSVLSKHQRWIQMSLIMQSSHFDLRWLRTTSAFSFGSNKTPGFHLEYATVGSTRNEPQYRENKRGEMQFSVTM